MVKKLLFFVFFLISFFSYSQFINELWWLRTDENIVYENSYENIFFDLNDEILKNEISNFIKTHCLTSNRKNKDKAIFVTIKYVDITNNLFNYKITYMSDYYSMAYSENSQINSITKLESMLVFFINQYSKYQRVNKDLFYGLLRNNFSDITNRLNNEYDVSLELNEDIVPTVISSLEHQIPYWDIIIKNNKLIDKKEGFD